MHEIRYITANVLCDAIIRDLEDVPEFDRKAIVNVKFANLTFSRGSGFYVQIQGDKEHGFYFSIHPYNDKAFICQTEQSEQGWVAKDGHGLMHWYPEGSRVLGYGSTEEAAIHDLKEKLSSL